MWVGVSFCGCVLPRHIFVRFTCTSSRIVTKGRWRIAFQCPVSHVNSWRYEHTIDRWVVVFSVGGGVQVITSFFFPACVTKLMSDVLLFSARSGLWPGACEETGDTSVCGKHSY